jgi:hypothetical protein
MWDLWWIERPLGQVFCIHFGFPSHSFLPSIARQSTPSTIPSWYKWPITDRSNSGPRLATAQTNIKNSVALSQQVNYTDWSAATCQRNLVSTFADRVVSHGQRSGSRTVVNPFSRPEPLLFFLVAPHLCSRGVSGPRSRPTATQKIW